MEQRFFILGTVKDPRALIRSRWPPPDSPDDPPFVAFNVEVDDWIRNDDVGHWILNGDTILTEVHPDDIADIQARIRIRRRGSEAVALD